MAKVLTDSQNYTDIANAIRAKAETTATYKPSEMATAITNIPTGGGGGDELWLSLIDRTVTEINDTAGRITKLGDSVFEGCSSLTTAILPACTDTSSYAFAKCRKLTTVSLPICTSVRNYAFYYCSSLESVSFPACTTIGDSAFEYCTILTDINVPLCSSIGRGAFSYCSSLTEVDFPACTTVASYAFYRCSVLKTVSIPVCANISSCAFSGCRSLTSLYLDKTSRVCALQHSTAFSSTPIAGYTDYADGAYGSIYVPASLFTAYQSASNWSYFSDRFVHCGYALTNAKDKVKSFDETETINIISFGDTQLQSATATSSNDSIVSASNLVIDGDNINFDITTYQTEGQATISISADYSDTAETAEASFIVNIYEEIPDLSCTVENLGYDYGFSLNSDGYYQNGNKGIDSSFAMCKVNIFVPSETTMYIDYIQSSESYSDYGLFSDIDTTLTADATADSENVYKSCRYESSTAVRTLTYTMPAGSHYIYVKYIKDNGAYSGKDILQFKIRFE